jgi:hypothetical protein
MQTIASHPVIATQIYPSHEIRRNSPELVNRIESFHVNIDRTKQGKYLVTVTPDWPGFVNSSFRSNLFDTESEARAFANETWLFVRDEWTGVQLFAKDANGRYDYSCELPTSKPVIPGYGWDVSLCPNCEDNTVTLRFASYHDIYTCPCGYEHSYSIGDWLSGLIRSIPKHPIWEGLSEMAKQVRIVKKDVKRPEKPEIDTRTPSGRKLPF